MKRIVLSALAMTMVLSAPSMAARVQSTMITHLNQVYQATAATATDTFFAGYVTGTDMVISAAPGVLAIDPEGEGEQAWSNFIHAAQPGQGEFVFPTPISDPVPFVIKNTSFVKQTPTFTQCATVFPARTITQQGTPNIRLWWPLMYETPSTTFTLTILYGTPVLYDDDGPAGPNPPAWVHAEQWVWHVDTDLPHLGLLLELFHELPFGLDEVPLISDEPLYTALQDKVAAADAAYNQGNLFDAAQILSDFELEVMDACIADSPLYPNPTGPGTGIANSAENPACCKLLVDVEYIFQTTGIGQPGKK